MRRNLWWIAVPALIVLIAWPLQTIIAALLVSTLFVMAGTYTLWMMRHPRNSRRLRSLDRSVHYGLIGALGVGVLVIALWPLTAAIAVLALAFVACASWVVADYLVRHGAPARLASAPAAVSTDEPEFWAEALLQPTPEPEPTPPEPVPSDPTPRVLATARRRPAARTRRLGPQAPRTGAPTRVRRRSHV